MKGLKSIGYVAMGICLGLGFGIALGMGLRNVGAGVAMGISVGVAIGMGSMAAGLASDAALTRKNAAAHKPSRYPLGL